MCGTWIDFLRPLRPAAHSLRRKKQTNLIQFHSFSLLHRKTENFVFELCMCGARAESIESAFQLENCTRSGFDPEVASWTRPEYTRHENNLLCVYFVAEFSFHYIVDGNLVSLYERTSSLLLSLNAHTLSTAGGSRHQCDPSVNCHLMSNQTLYATAASHSLTLNRKIVEVKKLIRFELPNLKISFMRFIALKSMNSLVVRRYTMQSKCNFEHCNFERNRANSNGKQLYEAGRLAFLMRTSLFLHCIGIDCFVFISSSSSSASSSSSRIPIHLLRIKQHPISNEPNERRNKQVLLVSAEIYIFLFSPWSNNRQNKSTDLTIRWVISCSSFFFLFFRLFAYRYISLISNASIPFDCVRVHLCVCWWARISYLPRTTSPQKFT